MNTPQEFAALLAGLKEFLPENPPLATALVTLIRTRGAAFRRPGARMLVTEDGRVIRGLSAGCPEADMVERARDALSKGQARCVRYDREHGFDVLMEAGCGGELEVLIEPLPPGQLPPFMALAAQCMQERRVGVMATAFGRDGTCMSRPLHWLQANDTLLDEFSAVGIPLPAPRDSRTRWAPCVETCATSGGEVSVFLEPLLPPPRVILIGSNATSAATARAASQLGWEVLRLTHRDDEQTSEFAPRPVRPDQVASELRFDVRTAVIVVTHHLERDLDYLRVLQNQPLAYLGAIGSRARSEKIRAAIPAITPLLRAPAGLDIGSETPEEIALAVIAEMQAVFAGRRGGFLTDSDAPIHGPCA